MKTVLSIPGGGIRGIIPAMLVSYIEHTTQKPIATMFDLIVGTSTGGILGLLLSTLKYTGKDIENLYKFKSRKIFPKSLWLRSLFEEKYNHKPLEGLLYSYFKYERLQEAKTKVMVTTYDIENRKPMFLKSWRDRTKQIEMRWAARATSAAPTYFEPTQIEILFGVIDRKIALIDGGVFINNPAMAGYVEAKKLWPDEEIKVVSLGTGEATRSINYEEACSWGMVEWLKPLLSIMFDGMSDSVDYYLKKLIGDNYFCFQTQLKRASDDMDDISAANILALQKEAETLIESNKSKLNKVCSFLQTEVK